MSVCTKTYCFILAWLSMHFKYVLLKINQLIVSKIHTMSCFLYLGFALVFSCTGKSASEEAKVPAENSLGKYKSKIIVLNYKNSINGYSVKAYWLPKEIRYSRVVGPAIIEFTNEKDTTVFSLTNNYFFLERNQIKMEYASADSTSIKSIASDTLSLVYRTKKATSTDGFVTAEEPFFFSDVNFDTKKELILVQNEQAQRFRDKYEAYDLDGGEPSLLNYEPFVSLDAATKIDFARKIVVINNSSGACSSSEEIYKLQLKTDSYSPPNVALVKIIDHEFDKTGCYQLIYSVNPKNGHKTLVSRVKLKN